MTEWTTEHCAEKPRELQLIARNTYTQRKNITEVSHEETDNMPAYTEWICDSREITVSEYNMLSAIADIDSSKAVDNYTAQLVEEGLL